MNQSPFISLPIAAASRMLEPTADSPAIAIAIAATVNGGPKRFKNRQPPLIVPAGCICFRLLCHASRIGGVIGKSGAIIKQMQQETSAKIRVEDPPAVSDDRVITVVASSSVSKTISFDEEQNSSESSEYSDVSAAQEALVRVFERILLVAAEADGGYFAPGGVVSCRLLADKSLVGSVIGKGGKVIEKIRKDTGCKIRILGQDKLPSCALPTDEMVEIEGDILAIKKALVAVARCLQDCLSSQRTKMISGRPHPSVLPNGHTDFWPPGPPQIHVFHPSPPITANHAGGGHPPVAADGGMVPPLASRTFHQEIVFRMLFSGDRVAGVIGKSGTTIHALQNDSGAAITIGAPVSDSDEQLITISAMESPDSRNSPAQNAVILVFNKSMESGFGKGPDSSPTSARLIISPHHMGCLLGKGGSIIADMRKVSGAVIKIVGDPQIAKFASDTDQIVLMTGEFASVREALYNVTGRLRNHLLFNKPSNYPGMRGAYARRNDHSNHQTNLTQSMDNLTLSGSMDHPPKPVHWQSQAGAGNPRSGQAVGSGSTNVKGGIELGSGSRSAMVTNMSVEIIVPGNVVGSVYGENGINLTRLRQISGAKVVVHEPHSGTTDRTVVISGTPDQTQSAQSLLQAFILADQC